MPAVTPTLLRGPVPTLLRGPAPTKVGEAGIQKNASQSGLKRHWIPAFAGMTPMFVGLATETPS